MISWQTVAHKQSYEQILSVLKTLKEGLGIKSDSVSLIPSVALAGDASDFETISQRLLLVSRVSYYLSTLQGNALTLQKQYKAPELYGLYEEVSELLRTTRNETDILRSILSSERELIKLR